ncbi:hypothetical protein E2C01_017065 [Portunus trituberculatus]|uniref:Uncharacterized protein n=1 Tax=Portunus trituberculatus TaxID=210409 RepID=A0A5B7DRY6_PORTR|nr:hypothetical protein [Portunus trituberculatus]
MSEVGVWPPLGISGRGAIWAGPVCAPRVVDVDVVVGVVAFAAAGWWLEGNAANGIHVIESIHGIVVHASQLVLVQFVEHLGREGDVVPFLHPCSVHQLRMRRFGVVSDAKDEDEEEGSKANDNDCNEPLRNGVAVLLLLHHTHPLVGGVESVGNVCQVEDVVHQNGAWIEGVDLHSLIPRSQLTPSLTSISMVLARSCHSSVSRFASSGRHSVPLVILRVAARRHLAPHTPAGSHCRCSWSGSSSGGGGSGGGRGGGGGCGGGLGFTTTTAAATAAGSLRSLADGDWRLCCLPAGELSGGLDAGRDREAVRGRTSRSPSHRFERGGQVGREFGSAWEDKPLWPTLLGGGGGCCSGWLWGSVICTNLVPRRQELGDINTSYLWFLLLSCFIEFVARRKEL